MKHNRVKLSLIPKIFAPAIAIAFILLATGVICQAQEFSPRARMNKFAQQPSNNSANAMFSGGRDLIDEAPVLLLRHPAVEAAHPRLDVSYLHIDLGRSDRRGTGRARHSQRQLIDEMRAAALRHCGERPAQAVESIEADR